MIHPNVGPIGIYEVESRSIRVVVRVHLDVCLSLPPYSGRDHLILDILVIVQSNI